MVNQPLRDPDPSKSIDIVEEHGSFLLIRAASGFAVVERRNWPDLSDEAGQARRHNHDGQRGDSAAG